MSTGFVAGAFNEQSFGLTVGFSVLTILLMLINKRKVPFWAIAGVISAICGTMFVLLAPGNKFECLRKYGYTPAGLYLHRFPGNIFDAVSVSFKVTKVLLFLTVAVLIWFIADKRKMAGINLKKKKTGKATEQKWTFRSFISNKNVFLMPCAFLLIAVGSVVVATALPYFDSPRLFFAVFVCFSLVLFSLISEAVAHTRNSKNRLNKVFSKSYMRIAVPVLICLFTVFDVGKEFNVYHRNFVVYSDVVNSIEDRVAAGEKNIVIHRGTDIVPRLLEAGRLQNFIFYWSVTSVGNDTNALENKWYAYCLGADTLSGG
jgi:Na+/melibiose symporter-like transporter